MNSYIPKQWLITLVIYVICISNFAESSENISCYQCSKTSNTPCGPEDLLPCPPISDRCVTHIMKDDADGYQLKRECGLGPCAFGDLMASKSLGLDQCDRSKREYFCIFCCRDNGCNNDNKSSIRKPSHILLLLTTIVIVFIDIFANYQPPFVAQRIRI